MRPDVVFYESFSGNGMLCNPEAIFRALLDDPEFAHIKHVWTLRSRRENRSVIREFAHHPRVRFVRHGSVAYYRSLAISGYLVNNATFPPEFSKRERQVYLNTWHGTPLKRMGYDIGEPASQVGNVIRNFLNADYLLAASPFMVDQMYERAYRLKHLYRGQIIEEGYPRIDRQFLSGEAAAAARVRLAAAGIDLRGRKVILYAPTWKGTNFNRPEDDAAELIARVAELASQIDTERYVVLLKTHQVVHKFATHRPELRGLLVPNEIPTNVVLGVSDILITDYSSVFFDFLPLERPILFFTPDIDDYAGYRGLYIEPEEWPGPVVRSVGELAGELIRLDQLGVSIDTARKHAIMRARFCLHEDGNATARIIDIVFRRNEGGYRILRAATDERTSILIHAGGMRPNGITSSLISLLDSIDHDRFDVSVVFPNSRRRAVLDRQRQLNPRVRQIARVGGMNGSKLSHWIRRSSARRAALGIHGTDAIQRRLWDDEWQRCFGSSRFDHVIDFSGYAPFWATLMLHSPDAHRSVWLHNDMAADAHRVIRGRRRHLRNLLGVFSLYREYDHLVSVSESLRTINSTSLAEFAPSGLFVSARNLMNGDRVLAGAEANIVEQATEAETGAVAEWCLRLTDPRFSGTTFVTVGRISPEKNHRRLIEAFALLQKVRAESRLVIVGDGPLNEQLRKLVDTLGLTNSIIFTGQQLNPYAIMAAADCFVMSSDYEGQPMVILEALVLGLPVVTVAFGSAGDALPDGVGLIVPSTSVELANGMAEFITGRVPARALDFEAYNRNAIAEFYDAVGLAPASQPSERSRRPI
ncbi:MAG: CDP-glycerol glycerophosphotransferase [Actinomycetota bacterium]|nr:CDP-glycerol glycerophosphotransferase [Actinomycetota bacterium]